VAYTVASVILLDIKKWPISPCWKTEKLILYSFRPGSGAVPKCNQFVLGRTAFTDKISWKLVQEFLSNLDNRQTNRQTNRPTNKPTKVKTLLPSSAEVIIPNSFE